MTPEDNDLRKLEGALIEAYRSRPTPMLGPSWAHGVMRDIHQLAPQSAQWSYLDHLVWRTAAIAVAFAIVLTVSVIVLSSPTGTQGTGLIAEELELTPLFMD